MPVAQAAGAKTENQHFTMNKFKLLSQAFRHGAPIPAQYSCRGQNVSPPLTIMNVPAGTKSLALIVHDPDAVSGDFTHWLVWDIPASTDIMAVNSLPVGAVQGKNDAGENGYLGPCPPSGTGTHNYCFKLYALDKTLGLPPNTNRHQFEQALEGHVIEESLLTGLFSAA